jgi:hypothetical protein
MGWCRPTKCAQVRAALRARRGAGAAVHDGATGLIDIGAARASPWCHPRSAVRACKRVFPEQEQGPGTNGASVLAV